MMLPSFLRRSSLWKIAFLALAILLNAALAFALLTGEQGLYSWRVLREKKSELAEELSQLDQRRAALSREIRLLKTDPAYVEKVIRQRLNYVRKNEILYLFDKNRPDGSVWTEADRDKK